MVSNEFDQHSGGDGWRRPRARTVAFASLAALVLAGTVVAAGDAGLWSGPGDSHARLVGSDMTQTAGGDVASDVSGVAELDSGGSAAVVAGPEAALNAEAGGRDSTARFAPSAEVAPAPPPGVPGAEPRVVKHAELAIEVDGSVTQAFDRVTDVARSQGGFVVNSSTSSMDDGPGSADLTLRVPAERFDGTRAALAEVGEVRSVQVSGDDVTAQLVDLEARLRALRAEEDALNGLLSRATSVGEVLAVRQQVSTNRLEIEQLAAQQVSLDDRATFSTVRVTLAQPGAATFPPESEPASSLAQSFERAVTGAVAVVGGMVVVLGYAGPFVVLGLLAWTGQRLVRIRRRPA